MTVSSHETLNLFPLIHIGCDPPGDVISWQRSSMVTGKDVLQVAEESVQDDAIRVL